MARKKRLNPLAVLDQQKKSVLITESAGNKKILRTVFYIRLSVRDNEKKEESSLENQAALLRDYIAGKKEFAFMKTYIDNGKSGVSYDRPAFREMMGEVKSGNLDCIIVKDLSRLGRNYLETGKYLEQIFPLFHIRFISVMDGYDSIRGDSVNDGMIIPLKNIMNESYAKDISGKTSGAFDAKRKQGKYLGNYPPYGYKKDSGDKGHLLIDEKTAGNVKRIFQWKLEGIMHDEIAAMLNASGISAPYRYYYETGLLSTSKYETSIWSSRMVKKLLMNQVYIGNMVSGKERSSLVTGIHRKAMPERDWFVTEGTHEAIICKEDFYKAQERR